MISTPGTPRAQATMYFMTTLLAPDAHCTEKQS
jgi:hypothetical protein